MHTNELDFHLPDECIAKQAMEPRDHAKLLVYSRAKQAITHHHVKDLPELGILKEGDLIVVNQTKVVPARFFGIRKATNGKVEGLFLEEPESKIWKIMLQSRGKPQVGEDITLGNDTTLTLLEKIGNGVWIASLHATDHTEEVLANHGSTPLPPYIRRARKQAGESEEQANDKERYNTIFAKHPGSVAAPTAGLHFTPELLAKLRSMGVARTAVTLHVGAGTFAPVKAEHLNAHKMHHEWISVCPEALKTIATKKANGGRILVIGTTSVRCLESLPMDWQQHLDEGYSNTTDLFIRPPHGDHPGFDFRFTDKLMTNFHLPKSTLLALVSALPGVGLDRLKEIYQEAIDEKYRFYSFGDAMIID